MSRGASNAWIIVLHFAIYARRVAGLRLIDRLLKLSGRIEKLGKIGHLAKNHPGHRLVVLRRLADIIHLTKLKRRAKLLFISQQMLRAIAHS